MGLYERLLKEITEQKWLYNDELVSFQKFNEMQYLLLNQSGKIMEVLTEIDSFNVGKENIEVYFKDEEGFIDGFTIKNLKTNE